MPPVGLSGLSPDALPGAALNGAPESAKGGGNASAAIRKAYPSRLPSTTAIRGPIRFPQRKTLRMA